MELYKLSMVIAAVMLVTSCDIKQKKETELPDVDVDVAVEEGQLPKFEVDWAKVNIGTKTKTINIPKVVIVMEEEEVEIPYIDIDMPNTTEATSHHKIEQNIMVEAEVTNKEHDIEIKEIRASGSTLYVISKLEATATTIGDKKMRISDQVHINAPELTVKHYIVGERPNRVFNSKYNYFSSMAEATSHIKNTKIIYSDS
jgi:hypothetical protein